MIKRTIKFIITLTISGLAVLANIANAEVELNYNISGFNGMAPSKQKFFIKDGKLRVSYTPQNYYLFDSKKNKAWMVDTSQKSYMLLSQNMMSDAVKNLAIQRDKLKNLLSTTKDLPAEARENIEKALASILMSEKNSKELMNRKIDKVVLTDTKKKEKVSGVPCQVFSAKSSIGETEVCYSEAEDAGIKIADVNVFNNYQMLMQNISGFNSYYALNKNTLPIDVKMGGQTLVKLKSVNIANRKSKTYFLLPSGYKDMLEAANIAK